MKNLSILIASCALILGSCAKNESGAGPDASAGTPGTIVFEVSTDGANATRGGTIFGAEATSDVAAVTIYAFKDDGSSNFIYDQSIPLDNIWELGDISTTATVPSATLDGSYQFVAVGTTTGSPYAIPTLTGLNYNAFVVTLSTGPNAATPIYSGFAAKTLTAGGFARVPITITRNVSGIMIYIKDIPTDIGGIVPTSLRLVATTQLNTAVNLTTNAGSTPAAATTLINIPLDASTGGIFDTNDDAFTTGVVALPFSQLGGTYVLPTDAVGLTLGLYAGETPIAASQWPLNMGGSPSINLEANTLYALGTKNLSTSLFGSDDTADDVTPPGGDDTKIDDNALDLMHDQMVLVEVDGSWLIEDLTLE